MLEALGNIGDFLGGIGVVVTLVYLAMQIRKNTDPVRSASLDSVSLAHSAFLDRLASDPDLTRIWFNGHSGRAEFTETDEQQFLNLLMSSARRWESAFLQSKVGTLDFESYAGIFAEYTFVFSSPGAQRYWKRIRGVFVAEFVEFAENAIKEMREAQSPPAA